MLFLPGKPLLPVSFSLFSRSPSSFTLKGLFCIYLSVFLSVCLGLLLLLPSLLFTTFPSYHASNFTESKTVRRTQVLQNEFQSVLLCFSLISCFSPSTIPFPLSLSQNRRKNDPMDRTWSNRVYFCTGIALEKSQSWGLEWNALAEQRDTEAFMSKEK